MENQRNSCQVRLWLLTKLHVTSLYVVETLLPVGVEGTKLHQHVGRKHASVQIFD